MRNPPEHPSSVQNNVSCHPAKRNFFVLKNRYKINIFEKANSILKKK